MYFVNLIRAIVLCKARDSSLGSHCGFISIGTDRLTSSKLRTCDCLHMPCLPEGNGTCKLSGLPWSVGTKKRLFKQFR